MEGKTENFVFKNEKIVPKRVGVVLDALDQIFVAYDIDTPAEVELEGSNLLSVEQATEEEVASQLSFYLDACKKIIEGGDIEGVGTVEDQISALVKKHVLFVPFISKARFLQREKGE